VGEIFVRKVVVLIIAALGLGITINKGQMEVFLMLRAHKDLLLISR
jgi:hypothetical protein